MSGRAELFRALAALCEPPAPAHLRLGQALRIPGAALEHDHTDLFVFQLYPYASVYLGEEGMLGGEAGDRVAGFWRALGLTPPAEPDHLATLLALYAGMIEQEEADDEPARRALRAESRTALLWEHLLYWLPAYLDKLRQIAPSFYVGWAAHLRPTAVTPAAPESGKELITWLLAPVGSGIVLV